MKRPSMRGALLINPNERRKKCVSKAISRQHSATPRPCASSFNTMPRRSCLLALTLCSAVDGYQILVTPRMSAQCAEKASQRVSIQPHATLEDSEATSRRQPTSSAVEDGVSWAHALVSSALAVATAAVLTITEGRGGFSLTGAVRLFVRAQIGMVSQAELVLLLGRSMSTRFLEAMGVLSSGLSIADDHPFIVLTETKFSSRCIPVWIGTLLT